MREPNLLAAVRENPADAVPRLVYADWLEEQGDADLAAYVRLECADRSFSELVPELVAVCERAGRPLGGWELAADLDRLREKMAALRKADTTLAVYGTNVHRYQMLPPIPEPDLLRFEQRLGFPLPAAYRAFLLHVGNGPMGEYNGLTPLDLGQDVAPLREPFPFARADFAASPDGWVELPDDTPDDVWGHGHLYLTDSGCGSYGFLVVNGDARGLTGGSDGNARFLLEGNPPRTFLESYEAWLDHSLRPATLEYARKQQQAR